MRGMRIMLERQIRAAGAAASADNEDAAKAAAEAQLLPPQAAGAAPEEAAPSGGAGAAASSSAFAGDLSCASLHGSPDMLLMCNQCVGVACLTHSAACARESGAGLDLAPRGASELAEASNLSAAQHACSRADASNGLSCHNASLEELFVASRCRRQDVMCI